MDPSGKNKYLTPCRTFGLQRTQKRTPISKGLPPQGGTVCGVSTPFRSPLIVNSAKSTPSAEKKPSAAPTPSWSTPLLPKSRVKMGLSKPSPKTDLFTKIHSKVMIQTPVKKSEILQTSADGSRMQIASKTKPVGKSNRLQKGILQCAPASSTRSNDAIDEGGGSFRADDKTQSAAELPEDSEEMAPPILSPQKPHVEEFPSSPKSYNGEKNTGDITLEKSSVEAHKESGNSFSQESFHGWDLENDQESVDCDLRRDAFKKCLSNFHTSINVESCVSNQHRRVTAKAVSPVFTTKGHRANKLSFVKEKFKSKRRLLSDSDDSDGNADDFSIQRKGSQSTTVPDPLGSSANIQTPEIKCFSLRSDSVDGDSVRSKQNRKSGVPSLRLGEEDCSEMDAQTDSEKENCDDVGIAKNEFINTFGSAPKKNKPKSRRRVLSDSEEDDGIRDECTMERERDVLEKLAPEKSVLSSNSDHNFITEIPDSVVQSRTPSQPSPSSQSNVEEVDGRCDAPDSDDDFVVRKSPERLPKSDSVASSSSKEDSSKFKLVVELNRLPESALAGISEGLANSGKNSQSKESSDDDTEGFPVLTNNFKTYGRPVLKEEKKKRGRLSCSRHSLGLPVAKRLSCLDESITLPTEGVQPNENEDEIKRQFVEISETEDFERMKNEMQKWLMGGQQVISQIIEEVRSQRDKDISVIEVLQEHNIDPNLVGYDPAVEEFVSFDKFLLKNNLL